MDCFDWINGVNLSALSSDHHTLAAAYKLEREIEYYLLCKHWINEPLLEQMRELKEKLKALE